MHAQYMVAVCLGPCAWACTASVPQGCEAPKGNKFAKCMPERPCHNWHYDRHDVCSLSLGIISLLHATCHSKLIILKCMYSCTN